MQLSVSHSTIRKSNRDEAPHFPPLASAKTTDQPRIDSDSMSRGDRLDVANFTDDLERHPGSLPSGAERLAAQRRAQRSESAAARCYAAALGPYPLISSMTVSSSIAVPMALSSRDRNCVKDSLGRRTNIASVLPSLAAVAAQRIGPMRPSVMSPWPFIKNSMFSSFMQPAFSCGITICGSAASVAERSQSAEAAGSAAAVS